MKTARSFTLVVAGLLGVSLLLAPLAHAAEEAPTPTAAEHGQKAAKSQQHQAKPHKQAHHHHTKKHHKTTSALDFGGNDRG